MQDFEKEHQECFQQVIEAHQRVVERWKDERYRDFKQLEDITEMHTEDALYRPFRFTEEIEVEFYEEVDEDLDGIEFSYSTIDNS